jgi:hypothetical protein
MLYEASLTGTFGDRMKDAEPDAISQESGACPPVEAKFQRTAACQNGPPPPEGDRSPVATCGKLQQKRVVIALKGFDGKSRIDGIPVLVANCAVNGADNLGASCCNAAQVPGFGLEKAIERASS